MFSIDSSYTVNGETRNMAVTQFEPADARRCFPCWDEPSFKVRIQFCLGRLHSILKSGHST